MNTPPGQPPGGGPPPGPQQPGYAVGQPLQPQPQPAPPGPMTQQPAPQAYQYAPAPSKDQTLALVSIGLAAAAWIMQFHLLMSIPAIIVGFMSLKKIKADPETYGGDGLAKAGIGIGIANVVLSLIGFGLAIVWIVFAILLEAM